jgi:hypothetical protein
MSKVRSKTFISFGVAIATLPLTLAVCCSTVKPVVAHSHSTGCKAQGQSCQAPKKSSSFPPEDEHGMIDFPRVPGGGYTKNQCVLLAALADKELGGNWRAIFITVNHVTGTGHCSLKREEENQQ